MTRSSTPPYVYYPPYEGAYRIWTVDGTEPRLMAQIDAGGHFIAANTLYSVNDIGLAGDRTVTVYIESVNPTGSPGEGDVILEVFPNLSSQSSVTVLSSRDRIASAVMNIAVDFNRDTQISFDELDRTTEDAPYRFWLNDDIDRYHVFEDTDFEDSSNKTDFEEDDIGPELAAQYVWEADCLTDNKATSLRDLEDFSRIQIRHMAFNELFRRGHFYLGLKWEDIREGNPAIRVYKHHDAAGGLGYLTDEATAQIQLNSYALRDERYKWEAARTSPNTLIQGGGVFILPTSFFADQSESNPMSCLLFEGVEAGKGRLTLVVLQRENGIYSEVAEGPGIWMELEKIGDMYEHWSVGNKSGGPPEVAVPDRIPSMTGSGVPFEYVASSPEDPQYILLVHGWNMEQWEKERFAETAYKRLWWQGYKGRFGLFSWPTTNRFKGGFIRGILDGTNFDRGEWTAWRSGAPLRELMETLYSTYAGELYVFSHSMGAIP